MSEIALFTVFVVKKLFRQLLRRGGDEAEGTCYTV